MNAPPPCRKLDPNRPIFINGGFGRIGQGNHPDPVSALTIFLGDLECIALLGVRVSKELRQVRDPVFIPGAVRRVQAIVVINEAQAKDLPIRGVAVNPSRGVHHTWVERWEECEELAIPTGHENATHMAARGAHIVRTEGLDEGLGRHAFTGLIWRARFRSWASRLDTGTVSLARSLFHAERSSITSSTVSA